MSNAEKEDVHILREFQSFSYHEPSWQPPTWFNHHFKVAWTLRRRKICKKAHTPFQIHQQRTDQTDKQVGSK